MPDAPSESSKRPNPMKVALGIVVLTGILAYVFVPEISASRDRSRLEKHGVPATATIVSLEDTGSRSNSNPEVRFALEITPDGGHPYRGHTTAFVSPVELTNYSPGTTVEVIVDPDDPSNVMLSGL